MVFLYLANRGTAPASLPPRLAPGNSSVRLRCAAGAALEVAVLVVPGMDF